MAHIVADRVLETTTTTGVGALTLAGAVAGYRTFASVCANADTAHYYIEAVDTVGRPTGAWETGTGTWGTGNLFTRTTVRASSNAGAAVSFAAGTKRVAISITAYAHTSLIATGSTGLFADGTAAAPSISFASDPDTGIFHSAANAVGIATGGVESMVVDAAGDVNVRRHLAVGTLGVPSNVVSIVASDNYSANGTRYGIQNNVTTDNTAALTADRLCYGAINQVVSTLQGAAAFTQTVRGAYNLAVIGPTGGYSVDGEGSLTGSYNLAQNQSTDATFNRCESLIGSYNFASLSGATALGDSVYGTYSLAQASGAGSTITAAYGVASRVQTNIAGATIGTGYLYYGDYATGGTMSVRYGLYIASTVNNYVAGGFQVGGTALAGTSAAGIGVGVAPAGLGTILATGSITSQTQHLGLATDTAAAPSFSWTGDTNTGMFRVAADALGLSTAGLERLRITAAGFVGIGVTVPAYPLDVAGAINATGAINANGLNIVPVGAASAGIEVGGSRTADGAAFIDFHGTTGTDYDARIIRYGGVNAAFEISNSGTGGIQLNTAGAARLNIDANGRLTIAPGVAGENAPLVMNGIGASVLCAFQTSGTSRGYVGLGPTVVNGITVNDLGLGVGAANSIVFGTLSGAERMRIEASGNVAIGPPPNTPNGAGLNVHSTGVSKSYFAAGDVALNTLVSPAGFGGGLVIIRGYNGNTGGGFSRLYAYWGQVAGGMGGAGMTLVGSAGDTSPAFVMAQAGGFLRITASGTLGGQWVVSYFAM